MQNTLKYHVFTLYSYIPYILESNPHLSFNRPLRAAPSEVARWVSAAWKAIPENIIVRSFKKCCISNALDGSEHDILWEDDGEIKMIVTG